MKIVHMNFEHVFSLNIEKVAIRGGGYFKRRSHVLKFAPNQGGVYKMGKVFKPNRTVHSLSVLCTKKEAVC